MLTNVPAYADQRAAVHHRIHLAALQRLLPVANVSFLESQSLSSQQSLIGTRMVPNAIFQVAEIPRALSGKKQELPIKKLLLGQLLEKGGEQRRHG